MITQQYFNSLEKDQHSNYIVDHIDTAALSCKQCNYANAIEYRDTNIPRMQKKSIQQIAGPSGAPSPRGCDVTTISSVAKNRENLE